MPSNAHDPTPPNPNPTGGTSGRPPGGRLLITAGPTHEPIDDVRYIANRSSGRLGIAIANAAADLFDEVTLLLGPVNSETPDTQITTHRFRTTEDLGVLLDEHFPHADTLIMAAAVADYRTKPGPDGMRSGKLKREDSVLTLELEATPDLVARCAANRRKDQLVVGFALEEEALLAQAGREKLVRKGLDAIIANPLGTMESSTISNARFITADGEITLDPSVEKTEFARWLIRSVQERRSTGAWTCLGSPPLSPPDTPGGPTP